MYIIGVYYIIKILKYQNNKIILYIVYIYYFGIYILTFIIGVIVLLVYNYEINDDDLLIIINAINKYV